MNSLLQFAASFGQILQKQLFPIVEEEVGPLSERHQQFVRALALLQLDGFVAVHHGRGRPPLDRAAIARAFLAKAIWNLTTTRALLDRLDCDPVLRRLCGWETASAVPGEDDFSRAFAGFARTRFAEQVHAAVIERTIAQRTVGHVSRDSSAIEGREKPAPKPKAAAATVRRLHRKAGSAKRPEQMTRLERQCSGTMSLEEMLAELPHGCDVGCKTNSKGHKTFWTGFKLHMDVADGQIPISCILTSASLNDSQAAVPLATMTNQRVTSFYDLMDSGYDCEAIRQHSANLGHVAIIAPRKHGSQKRELVPHEKQRLQERNAVERVFGRLKDEFGGATVRVRGWAKVTAHLMFGILALTADQLSRWLEPAMLET